MESCPPIWYKDNSIKESFDFEQVNKKKKAINIYGMLKDIEAVIEDLGELTQEQYNILVAQTAFYKIESRMILLTLIHWIMKQFGNTCNLNWIDVSGVDSLAMIFYASDFNGDISHWNVSNVKDMWAMF